MYIMGSQTDSVYQYNLSTLFDLSSASYNSGTTYTDYVISLTNKSILDKDGIADALADVISTTLVHQSFFAS